MKISKYKVCGFQSTSINIAEFKLIRIDFILSNIYSKSIIIEK